MRVSKNQPIANAMIAYAVIAAPRCQLGCATPAMSTAAATMARPDWPIAPAFSHPRPATGVSQLPITRPTRSTTTNRPPATTADTHGSHIAQARCGQPDRPVEMPFISPFSGILQRPGARPGPVPPAAASPAAGRPPDTAIPPVPPGEPPNEQNRQGEIVRAKDKVSVLSGA